MTKSAKDLGVTQSAISHSLKKLREHLGDEIVYRQGNTLELTQKAKDMKQPLKKWFDQIEDILYVDEFDPKTSQKVFYIAATDIIEQLYVPELIKRLQKEAPNIQVRFLRWEFERVETQLLSSSVDLAIGVRTLDSANIMQRIISEETFVSMARKNHPIFKDKIDLESFLAYPHVMTGPGLVENSDCLLTAPRKFMEHATKRHKVKLFEIPIDMKPFTIKAYWNKSNKNDKANKWLREIIYSL